MRFRRRALSLCVAAALAGCRPPVEDDVERCELAVTHVTVVDVEGGRLLPDRTVAVCGRHVGDVSTSAAPAARVAQRIDGSGKFLIPGLWDAHVHSLTVDFAGWFGPLALANGVTSARDMGFYSNSGLAARLDVAAGRVTGPRLLVSMRLDGPSNAAQWVRRAATHDEGAEAVREARRLGLDFVKVYSSLPRDAYLGALAEAQRLGIPVDGHVPYAVSVTDAVAAGQRTIEHEDDLMRACTVGDDSLRRAFAARHDSDRPDDELRLVRAAGRAMREHPDARQCETVAELLAARRVAVVPTLVVYQPYAAARTPAVTHPERDRFVPSALRESWLHRLERVTDADTAVASAYFSYPRTLMLQGRGVRLLAGTDTPLPYVVPGFSLHDELALLVRAGLTPLQALRSATTMPPTVFGMRDSLGAIAPGQLADLVLLDANPLADIANTRRIRAVVANGRYFDRAALDALLAQASRRAVRE
jgi:cytosine/adenosine deaminase-related metal-dependent hydrolase